MIPLFKVWMNPEVGGRLLPVLHSGYIGEGERVKEFEHKFGEFILNDRVVMVNSGTSALMLALKLCEVGPGDTVISTPVTCLATNTAILAMGADILWADVYSDGTINPYSIPKVPANTKAMMVVDWGGLPCFFSDVRTVASALNIPVIEDACQSVGATSYGLPTGSDADYVAFSFQAIKVLTTGDGGALVVNAGRSKFHEAKLTRWFGLDRSKGIDMRCIQDPPCLGYKWQMNDITASIGLANMEGLEDRIRIARRNAGIYNKAFGVQVPGNRDSANWLYTITVNDVHEFILFMKDKGIECSRVHDRNDTKTIFKKFWRPLPGVDWFDKHHVCIPVGWWVTEGDAIYIMRQVQKYRETFEPRG